MLIFSWIVLGLAAVLLAFSGVCWAAFIGLDDRDWRKLAVKVFRLAMVVLLLYVNVAIYAHIVSGFRR